MKKKNKKNIAIIGGGIIGCVLSLILSKNGHKVEVYDYRNKLGGILGDFEKQKIKFFRGCQYINPNSFTKKYFNKFSNDFKVIEHRYSSYTSFLKKDFFSKKYAVPVFKTNELGLVKIENKKNKINKINKNSLQDRIDLYPYFIKKNLNKFFKNINLNPKNIIYENYFNFQMGRIALPEIEKELIMLKKKSKIFDELYAVEKHILNFNDNSKAILPKKGYDYFFGNFEKSCKKKNIKIFKSSNVRPIWKKKDLEIFIKDKKIDADHIIWTGNPVKLINNYLNDKLESISFKVLQISANLKENNISETYTQVYSDVSSILRIFIYKFDGQNKINIECCINNKTIDETKVLEQAKNILKKLGISVTYQIKTISSFKDVRFNLITINDKNSIINFNNKTKNSKLINSPWLVYGREEKLNFYINEFLKKKLI